MYPVDKIEFWKQRISDANKRGHKFWTVYVTKESDWAYINEEHGKILERETNEGDRVLDAGCGYGRWAELFDPATYVGIDFSPDLIQMAKEDFPDYNFQVGDLRKLKFKDKTFDVAFCVSIKEMIINNCGQEMWDEMEDELRRVAKKVLILEYTDPDIYDIL